MSKNKQRKQKVSEPQPAKAMLSPEVKRSIVGIAFCGLAAILFLAAGGQAGPVGDFLYRNLSIAFGVGYYFIPTIFAILGISLLTSGEKREFGRNAVFGAVLFVIAGLSLLDILYPEKGGVAGNIFGMIEAPFGKIAGLIIGISLFLISVLVTLDIPLKLPAFKKKPAEETIKPIFPAMAEEKPQIVSPMEAVKPNERPKEKETELEVKEPEEFGETKRTGPGKKISFKNYVPPPLSLLNSQNEKPTSGDLRANANIIRRTLESFGIPVEMGEITIGPKVTRYTLKPAEGIKLSRITALNQDLALALAAHPLRIEAPIPGKSLVGIEVPNKSAAIVRLGSLMAYPEFGSSSTLTFSLGREISGDPVFPNIAKMPHLLIAGATGSGKSVVIHSLIVSLLYKNSPETLKFIMIDPKRVELTPYNKLPHLVAPVITEGKKAVASLRWAISEMDRRYDTLMQSGNRDIQSYNASHKEEPMNYIVIVIDELADLMAAYGREIEGSIVRLAQMARATGIHLVVSTQRPSVEVITGLIKANITSRIALQVASQVDSRTILDMAGAEKLLGGGDMLYVTSDLSKPKRIQGAYITEGEIKAVAGFIAENNEPEMKAVVDDSGSTPGEAIFDIPDSGDADDELYPNALQVVTEAKKASASLLQRRLKIGYARAARLLDIMEDKGIIGPGEGAKPRDVYLDQLEQTENQIDNG
ncbi:MAG: DNA translocase FtsK [Patescibacteria group bacterium]|nr:DNA translocase FtsK [Patescibacteria group bacterium]MCL5262209.1 DNA translocase FtsK [Patescibacteria group bacterium]